MGHRVPAVSRLLGLLSVDLVIDLLMALAQQIVTVELVAVAAVGKLDVKLRLGRLGAGRKS